MTDLEHIELALRKVASEHSCIGNYTHDIVADALRDVADELKRVSEKRKQDKQAESDIDT